jgi:zinc protease
MKNFRFLLAFVFFGFLFTGSYSQITDLNSPVPPDPDILIGKLDNGLSYYIKQNKKPAQRIELRLAVNAGSICETDGQLGLAHFCEHMCFNGTKNFPGNKIVDTLEEMGVKFGKELNAATGFDQTVYMLKVPTDNMEWIDRGFQVLEDWAHLVNLDDAEIEKERNVIIEEWRLGLGAGERMMSQYMPVLFKGSIYADRLPIGKVDVIKSFLPDTLRDFYKNWYRPDLMAVVVVGDIDPKLAEEKVKEYFGRIPKAVHPRPRVEAPIPGNSEPIISVVTDKEASGFSANILYKHPKSDGTTFAGYRRSLMRSLYTQMLNARLQEIATKPDASFLYAGAGYGSFIGRTIEVYSIYVASKENQLQKSIELVLNENEKVRRQGFTATELERAKKNTLAMYENYAKESDKTESGSYADEYIRNYMDLETIPGIKKEFEMTKEFLPGVSLDELNTMGRELITDENIIALITAPEKEGNIIPGEKDVAGIIRESDSKEIDAYVDKVSDEPLLAKVPKGTSVIKRRYNKDFDFTELKFGNGVRMVLKSTDFKNDEIVLSAYSPGGTSQYPDSSIMAAVLAPAVISQSGLGSFDQTGLQKKLSGNTASLRPYISELSEGVTGSCSPKDFETMLQLNYLYFKETRRDEDAYNAYISRILNVIKPMRSDPHSIYSDTLAKILALNSPRVFGIPSDAMVKQVNLDKTIGIFKDRFADAGDFTYFMAGNFKVDEVIPLLEVYIGGLPSTGRKENWKDVTPGFPKGKLNVDIPINSEPQATVTMVWKGDFGWKEKDRQSFSMLMNILSIKCRESMREDQGGVYGVSIGGSTSKFPKPAFNITASWGCAPENIASLSNTLLDEITKIKKDGPSVADLNKVKETLVRARESDIKENGFWLGALQNYFIYNLSLLSLDDYKVFVNSITPADIKAIATKYADTNHYVEVSLSPAATTGTKQ